jgi:hypothetical protein
MPMALAQLAGLLQRATTVTQGVTPTALTWRQVLRIGVGDYRLDGFGGLEGRGGWEGEGVGGENHEDSWRE